MSCFARRVQDEELVVTLVLDEVDLEVVVVDGVATGHSFQPLEVIE